MPPPRPPIRVLVIDDDEMSRELLTLLLEGEGYKVDSAESGEDAFTTLQARTSMPDLILTDMHLPGIDGAILAGELRARCGASTLLLAISGSQPPAAELSAFDGFLLKPFQMADVAAALLTQKPSEKANAPASEKGIGTKSKESPASSTNKAPRRKRTLAATPHPPSAQAPAPQNASNNRMDPAKPVEIATGGAACEAALPILNETIFQQLSGTMLGSQLREMYHLCLDDARRRIAAMRKLTKESNAALFIREAHAIKGGAGMLGATELHRKAAELESRGLAAGSRGSAQDVNSLDELSAACDRLERMLGARL